MKSDKKKTPVSQYDKIKNQLKRMYRMDRESNEFLNVGDWCANRMEWARKFKKITEAQFYELIEELTKLFEGDY